VFNSFRICVDKDLKPKRPEVYPEIHDWINENVAGANFKERSRNMTNFYKKYFDKAPIITASEDLLEALTKTLK